MSGDDEKHMGKHTKTSTDTEKKICEENDCTYHFINSHSGFKGSNHLQLMSSCKYFIIPNSSFAWWSAYLSNKKDVYYPEEWILDYHQKIEDLFPKEWIKIK